MPHLSQYRENIFNLRNFRELATHNKNTSNYGLETVSYRAPFLWAKLPSELPFLVFTEAAMGSCFSQMVFMIFMG